MEKFIVKLIAKFLSILKYKFSITKEFKQRDGTPSVFVQSNIKTMTNLNSTKKICIHNGSNIGINSIEPHPKCNITEHNPVFHIN